MYIYIYKIYINYIKLYKSNIKFDIFTGIYK
jgi:hypothetical protein